MSQVSLLLHLKVRRYKLAILDKRLFHVWAQIPFTTIETELDYYHQRVYQFPQELPNNLEATSHPKRQIQQFCYKIAKRLI